MTINRKFVRLNMYVFIFILVNLASRSVFAHGDLHHQIEALDKQLQGQLASENSIELQIKRARLKNQNEQYQEAIVDLEHVLHLDPKNIEANYYLAFSYVKTEDFAQAEEHILAFKQSSRHQTSKVKANALLAEIYQKKGDENKASQYYTLVIEQKNDPQPDDYLNAANSLRQLGTEGQKQALQILNEGVKKIGDISSLLETAIEIDLQLAQYTQAIERIDLLLSKASGLREVLLLERKSQLYTLAAKPGLALQCRQKAITTINRLPRSKRHLAPVEETYQRLIMADNSN